MPREPLLAGEGVVPCIPSGRGPGTSIPEAAVTRHGRVNRVVYLAVMRSSDGLPIDEDGLEGGAVLVELEGELLLDLLEELEVELRHQSASIMRPDCYKWLPAAARWHL